MRTIKDIEEKLSRTEREELELITERIKKSGSIAIIILYGSYARNEQVRNYDGKMSDYDILVISSARNEKSLKRIKYLLGQLFQDIGRKVSCEVESIENVTKKFKEDYYFYADVRRDGVVLYKKNNVELPQPEDLTNERQLEISENYFKTWFSAAKQSFKYSTIAKHEGETDYCKAAFELQQCAENCYKTIELVHDRYAPKEHRLGILRGRISKIAPEIYGFFPVENEEQEKDYKYLDEAYIRARYDDTYIVTETRLDYWRGEAEKLMQYTEQICKEHIQKLEEEAKQGI